MTAQEWYEDQVRIWGENHVEDLISNDYLPFLTTEGWRWVKTPNEQFPTYVEQLEENPKTASL